jgi:hypothetical protein
MRRDVLADTSLLRVALYRKPETLAGHRFPQTRQKHLVLGLTLHKLGLMVLM